MKAITVNEALGFHKTRDPKKALGMSYGNKPNTTAWKVIQFIKNKGKEGASLEEIQKFIYVDVNKHTEEEFYKKTDTSYGAQGGRATRGYWNTNLLGGGFGPNRMVGLLHKFCNREVKPDGKVKWVLNRMPEPGENLLTA